MAFRLNTLVELQDQYSNVYPLSPTGARGWVRARREMPQVDPEVYIEWDKTHWRYHGEKDGWTYEHHFKPVEDVNFEQRVVDEPSKGFVNRILEEAKKRVEEERCPNCGGIHSPEDGFLETLQEAQEAALESEGYFIVTLKKKKHGEYLVYEPEIYAHALSDMAQQMIEAQLVHVACQLFDQKIIQEIKNREQ